VNEGDQKLKDEIEIERDEEYRPPPQENRKNTWAKKRNLILIAAGALIVVLVFFFWGVSGKDKSRETFAQMAQRLDAMEQKIAALQKQQEDLVSGPLRGLAEKVEMLEKRPAQKPEPAASPKAHAAPPTKRYHTVKKGETIRSIAKRYGLSAEELRRMNKLSPKTALTVGQNLIVRTGKKK
jgi:LysM repeat protein